MEIRRSALEDIEGVLNVYAASFDGPQKSVLLAGLHESNLITASLVAIEYGEIIAHISFSDLIVDNNDDDIPIKASAIATIAIAPTHQHIGIGSELIRQGLEICIENGDEAVFIATHSAFFKRFGFYRIHDSFIKTSVSGQNFMVLELKSGVFDRFSGNIIFPDAYKI